MSTQPPTDPPTLPVLFRDQRFVVIDKPAGLAVHAGPNGGASVEDSFPALSRRRDGPWLAHRLDADTAGCLVIALKRAALHAAQAEFIAGRAEKIYWAVVRGRPPTDTGSLAAPLAKQTARTGWRMVVHEAGLAAVTRWRLRGHAEGLSWLELRPLTGRTHQLRVHCATLGCPLLGDPLYGTPGPQPARLHLLARSIVLHLAPPLLAVAEPPSHMRPALAALGYRPPPADREMPGRLTPT